MANERMTVHPWRWQDGMVVTAMQRGWWIVLDELNLAEPQILERLNPVLERYPTLVLSEHDNRVIGQHRASRCTRRSAIFATMNPAEYAGRSPMSPAYRDRWRAYRFVQAPRRERVPRHASLPGLRPPPRCVGRRRLDSQGSFSSAPPWRCSRRSRASTTSCVHWPASMPPSKKPWGRKNGSRGTGLGQRGAGSATCSLAEGLLAVMDYLASALATDGGGVRSMRQALSRGTTCRSVQARQRPARGGQTARRGGNRPDHLGTRPTRSAERRNHR